MQTQQHFPAAACVKPCKSSACTAADAICFSVGKKRKSSTSPIQNVENRDGRQTADSWPRNTCFRLRRRLRLQPDEPHDSTTNKNLSFTNSIQTSVTWFFIRLHESNTSTLQSEQTFNGWTKHSSHILFSENQTQKQQHLLSDASFLQKNMKFLWMWFDGTSRMELRNHQILVSRL